MALKTLRPIHVHGQKESILLEPGCHQAPLCLHHRCPQHKLVFQFNVMAFPVEVRLLACNPCRFVTCLRALAKNAHE